jgi:hypothetical protein
MDNADVSTTQVATLMNFVAQITALLHLSLNSVDHVLVVDLMKLVVMAIHARIFSQTMTIVVHVVTFVVLVEHV